MFELSISNIIVGAGAVVCAIFGAKIARAGLFVAQMVGSLGLIRGMTVTSLLGMILAAAGAGHNLQWQHASSRFPSSGQKYHGLRYPRRWFLARPVLVRWTSSVRQTA